MFIKFYFIQCFRYCSLKTTESCRMEECIFLIGTLFVQTVGFNNKQHMWTELIWLSTGIIVGSFEHSNKPWS